MSFQESCRKGRLQELEIMKPLDSLATVPEGLIQELIHMKNEGLPGEPGQGDPAATWMVVMAPDGTSS